MLIETAKALATRAHDGQVRKYTGEPYISHPQAVVAIVETVDHTPEMVAAAWLHDVVEDTKFTLDDIRAHCGNAVADLVYWLTDKSKPGDGNRKARKLVDRLHLAQAPAAAQTIKLADLLDNLASIAVHDQAFAAVYRVEKQMLLEVMKAGDPYLYDLAYRLAQVQE